MSEGAKVVGGSMVTSPLADVDLFGRRDLDALDHGPVPDRLEERVADPEGKHVLNRVLGQVVVDAKDLAFVEERLQLLVQGSGAAGVLAERLLDHDAPVLAPAGEPGVGESGQDRAGGGGRGGEVVDDGG